MAWRGDRRSLVLLYAHQRSQLRMQTPRLEGRELETGTDRNEIEEGLARGVIYGAVAGQSEK